MFFDVPLAKVGAVIARVSQQRGRTGRCGLVYVKKARDRPAVSVSPRKERAARGGADRAVGIGAAETDSLPGQAIHRWGLHVWIAHVAHGLATMFVGEDIDHVGACRGHLSVSLGSVGRVGWMGGLEYVVGGLYALSLQSHVLDEVQ